MVEPKLSEKLEELRGLGEKSLDWAKLYHPLSKYMLHAFTLALEAKKQDILRPAVEVLLSGGDFNYTKVLAETVRLVSCFRPNCVMVQGRQT